jgi:hypothetical protein
MGAVSSHAGGHWFKSSIVHHFRTRGCEAPRLLFLGPVPK